VIGLVCTKLDHPPPGTSPTGWARLVKLLTLVDRFPW
jgi:hypothetical protein